jgi:peptide/nickel transport system substrate-binding protein
LEELFDPYFNGANADHFEHTFRYDETLDRSIWAFKIGWAPIQYTKGNLLESWEVVDGKTVIGHIRKGVYYQNKEPANGRELTSYDLVFHYDRVNGTGSGFTEPNPFFLMWRGNLRQVTATDDYTVVFEFSIDSWANIYTLTDVSTINVIECPELVQLGASAAPVGGSSGSSEGIGDWHLACGTGAYILSDFMNGSSITYTKNPDYWGYDDRYPENRLPYIETIKTLVIPDSATQQAAFRTGKIDMLGGGGGGPGGGGGINWQQGKALEEDMPNVQKDTVPGSGTVYNMKCNAVPFTDIRVRKALQLAVDLKAINDSIYGGMFDPTPAGLIHPMFTGWTTPYADWPQELKDEYSYNPTKAKELLAEAGYPNGFDTNIYLSSTGDMSLPMVIKAYFKDIGVEMEIKTIDAATSHDFMISKKYDQMTGGSWVAFPRPPVISVSDLIASQPMNTTDNNDPVYDEMAQKVVDAANEAEAKKAMIETDMYVLKQHWGVVLFPTSSTVYWQPRIKGNPSEQSFCGWRNARLWLDDTK